MKHYNNFFFAVNFDDCSGHKRTVYMSDDSRFQVDTDGTIKVKRAVNLLDGHESFSVNAWDSSGKKLTTRVTVENELRSHHLHDKNSITPGQPESSPDVPVLVFPQSSSGERKRQKRDWVIPLIAVSENNRGTFPQTVVKIKSNNDKEAQIVYSITGPGVDQPPVGIFTIDKNTGQMYVTQPLDREKIDHYTLMAHAVAAGGGTAEDPMEIIINVIDQNDNSPEFTKDTFLGNATEASPPGTAFMTVTATDKDDPETDYGIIKYSIISQEPKEPNPNMFMINPVTGVISVASPGLDREFLLFQQHPEYTLLIGAADMDGKGQATTATAVITVTDSNDNAPQFTQVSYTVTVPENKVDFEVVKLPVTDMDEPHTPAWNTRYTFVKGNEGGFFNVSTGPGKMEGIVRTAMVRLRCLVLIHFKGLDFEKNSKYTFLITVENEVPFATRLPTATATVVVNVEDVNEAPIFDPPQKTIRRSEDLEVGAVLDVYKATDPDTARKQAVGYGIGNDPAGWLSVAKDTGLIRVRNPMDRESPYVKNGLYKALILAFDDENFVSPILRKGTAFMTVTATDKDDPETDNGIIKYSIISQEPKEPNPNMFMINPVSGVISVASPGLDREGLRKISYLKVGLKQFRRLEFKTFLDGGKKNATPPPLHSGPPFNVEQAEECLIFEEHLMPLLMSPSQPLSGPSQSETSVVLHLKTKLEQGDYNVVLRLFDAAKNFQDNTLLAKVCNCKGPDPECMPVRDALVSLPGILGVLGAILGLLLLILLLLMFLRRRTRVKKEPLIPEDDIRDNVFYYDEEGGGEEDQEYDLSQLHRGLDNRPEVFRNDVVPTFTGLPAPQYRPRPANPEEIGNFIEDNLKAADSDPTAPPYDSLLVFDYEGGGSEAGSLSSLNSSSSGGDQDYDCLGEWGPRFKKLADMYGGGED
ncbi:CADH1 protein, partial [Atractosteus spatula]|nr:CADH1 protein [Atractosteus spatula]